ncbi:Uncharacterised protein [uncultured archaeon]|nr:Uncharacterised protein [uncultured archaeon]
MTGREEGHAEGKRERHRWLSQRREEGLVINRITEYVYEIYGKKVLIKFTNPRKNNVYWFDVTKKALNNRNVFVWLCEKSENYYVIPNEKMNELIKAGNWYNERDDCPTFELAPTIHKYLPANRDVSFYYRNISLLR